MCERESQNTTESETKTLENTMSQRF